MAIPDGCHQQFSINRVIDHATEMIDGLRLVAENSDTTILLVTN